jgi:LPS sulfotransferase NodH
MTKIQLINQQKRLIKELLNYTRYSLQRSQLPAKKFVIFGRGRSGSTLLVNLLDSHPQIHCDNEILHDRVLFPRQYIDSCASRYHSQVYGFKLLSYQLKEVQRISQSAKFILELYQSGYQIIYLKRENLLHHALSNIAARQKQKFHYRVSQDKVEKKPIYVEVEELVKWLSGSEQLDNFEHQILQNIPHLPLTYENNLQESLCHQTTVDLIFELLDIPSVPVKTNLIKAMPLKLTEMVSNYEEIIKSLQGTKYEKFLEFEL